jgi:hypothetical protein
MSYRNRTWIEAIASVVLAALLVGGLSWAGSAVNNPPTSGGGGGTVIADSPLTGNGSSGSHLGLQASSQSVPGSMSAADKGYLDYLSGRWEQVEERFLLSKIPQLTGFTPDFPGSHVASGTTVPSSLDGLCEGSCLQGSSSVIHWYESVYQDIKTAKWGACFYAKMATGGNESTHLIRLGFYNGAHNRALVFGTDTVADATHFVLISTGNTTQATTVVSDTLWHWHCLAGDATNVKYYIDGNDSGASYATSVLTTEAEYPAIVSTVAGEAVVSRAIWGFVQP